MTTYDALDRPVTIDMPDNTHIEPGYDDGGRLNSVKAKIRGASSFTDFVTEITYNEKGQRNQIQYANSTKTKYTYDEQTFRMIRLLTTRNSGQDILQDINYTYDATGNIVEYDDNGQQTHYFNNAWGVEQKANTIICFFKAEY